MQLMEIKSFFSVVQAIFQSRCVTIDSVLTTIIFELRFILTDQLLKINQSDFFEYSAHNRRTTKQVRIPNKYSDDCYSYTFLNHTVNHLCKVYYALQLRRSLKRRPKKHEQQPPPYFGG